VSQHSWNPKQQWRRPRVLTHLLGRFFLGIVASSQFVGCADGPLFAIKQANPYYRAQWKKDAEKGIVSSKRTEEIRLVRTELPSMSAEEQTRWTDQLAKVYDLETSPVLRREAVMALGNTQNPEAEAALVRACSDKNDKVRLAACKAMAGQKSTAASKMLKTVAQSDKNENVRQAAIRSLGAFKTDDAKAILRKSLDEKAPALQLAATDALKVMTGKDFKGNVENWRKFIDGQPVEEPQATVAERLGSAFQMDR